MVISTLVPPGNIVKELELYKRRIFSLYGSISSLALPVFSLCHRADGGEALRDPRLLNLQGGAIGEVFNRGGSLYLRLDGSGLPQASYGTEEFPEELNSPHLLLMAWDREGFSKAPTLPPPPRFSWGRWEYRNYEITLAPLPRWWEKVFCREIPLPV